LKKTVLGVSVVLVALLSLFASVNILPVNAGYYHTLNSDPYLNGLYGYNMYWEDHFWRSELGGISQADFSYPSSGRATTRRKTTVGEWYDSNDWTNAMFLQGDMPIWEGTYKVHLLSIVSLNQYPQRLVVTGKSNYCSGHQTLGQGHSIANLWGMASEPVGSYNAEAFEIVIIYKAFNGKQVAGSVPKPTVVYEGGEYRYILHYTVSSSQFFGSSDKTVTVDIDWIGSYFNYYWGCDLSKMGITLVGFGNEVANADMGVNWSYFAYEAYY